MKYYGPSTVLLESLFEELHTLSSKDAPPQSEDYRIKNTKSKRKYDLLEKIFQGFVDLVYFLEFVEDHPELHESYENFLKDLFGINIDDSSPQPSHYKDRSTSLFVRFITASLLNTLGNKKEYDFRLPLANVLIFQAIEALQARMTDDTERKLFLNNAANTKLWSQLLASRYESKDPNAHRRIGYCLPLPYSERIKMEK
jgi:hypothetical protein